MAQPQAAPLFLRFNLLYGKAESTIPQHKSATQRYCYEKPAVGSI